jgi:hypothetical protein
MSSVDINAVLGKVGLPEPLAALAGRDWDAIVVGDGHNGLTAAASAAPAPSSDRSPTSATWSARAPTSSACSTGW